VGEVEHGFGLSTDPSRIAELFARTLEYMSERKIQDELSKLLMQEVEAYIKKYTL